MFVYVRPPISYVFPSIALLFRPPISIGVNSNFCCALCNCCISFSSLSSVSSLRIVLMVIRLFDENNHTLDTVTQPDKLFEFLDLLIHRSENCGEVKFLEKQSSEEFGHLSLRTQTLKNGIISIKKSVNMKKFKVRAYLSRSECSCTRILN